jgi:uncharacterized membrane protein YdjX (TVP38/TMEM64 family)
MLKKVLILGIYLLAAVALAVYRGPLIRWMESDTVWYLDILIGFVGLLIALVPAIPYGIVAVIMGAKYGAVMGSGVNIVISVSAAVFLFLFVRAAFTEEGRRKTANMRGVATFTEFAERNPFYSILFARLLPILPAQAINIFAAITRIPLKLYFFASLLGKIPFILLVTLLGDQFIHAPDFKGTIITLSVYGIFLLAVYEIYRNHSNSN